MNRTVRLWLTVLGSATFFLALQSGCVSTGNYGYMKRSISLTEAVEMAEIQPDYNYYYSGPEGQPDALIGLDKQYTLTDSFWKPIELDKQTLQRWIRFVGTYRAPSSGLIYYANNMYGPDGTIIGLWYGYQDFATIRQVDTNTFTIYTPPARNLIKQQRIFGFGDRIY